MRTNRLQNLYQKLHQKLKLKSFLLIFASVIFLSACGIKGDLYQTPVQAVTSKNKVTEEHDASQVANIDKSVVPQEQAMILLDEPQKQQAVQQPIEQIKQTIGQSTEQVKE